MTAEEKKMTHESAKEIVARVDNMEEAAGRFNNLADLGSRYWIAKGFLLGRETLEAEEVKSLLSYTAHTGFCGQGQTGMGLCECGYREALARFTEFKESVK